MGTIQHELKMERQENGEVSGRLESGLNIERRHSDSHKNEIKMEQFKENKVVKDKYWSQYAAVISATIVSTIAGINFAWTSPSIPKLLSDEYPFDLSKEECSYIAITAPVGTVFGGPISAYLVDVIGRKYTLLSVAFPQILSFIFIYFSDYSPILLYIARFLGGLGEGANLTIMAMYIGEIASPAIRGNLGSYISLTLRTGILMINIVGSYMSIPDTSLVFLSLPLLFLATFSFMPESPYYLIMKGKSNQARSALKFLRRRDNVEEELDKLTRDVTRQASESGTFKDLWRIESNRKAMLISLGLRTVQQFSGISAFSLYTQILFKEAGSALRSDIASIIYTTIQLLTTFTSSIVVEIAGRKPLLIFSCVSCVIVLLMEGIFFTLRDNYNVDVADVNWLPLAGMIIFIIVFAIGLGTIVNLMLGELFSQNIKAKALCILNIYFAITMSATTKFFQSMKDEMGMSIPFFAFSVNCFVGIFFCWYFVPETKNKTLEEIQQELKGNKVPKAR